MKTKNHKPVLLYVDDEIDNLTVFKSAFRRNYDIHLANSAKEGADLLKTLQADVVISDQRMPQLNGVEFLSELPEEPDCVKILLTGFSDIEAVIKALNLGKIHKYVTKPWEKESLVEIIDQELAKLNQRREDAKMIEQYKQNDFIVHPDDTGHITTSGGAVSDEVLRMEHKLEQAYSNMQLLRDIGQDIFSHITVESIIESTYDNVNKLMDAVGFGVGIHIPERGQLEFKGYIEFGEKLPDICDDLDDPTQPSAWCFNNDKEMVIGDFNKEYNKYISGISEPKAGESPNSFVYMPVHSKESKIGVITVQSMELNAYTNYHLSMLRNIAIFVGSALENAMAYERIEQKNNEIRKQNEELEKIVESRTEEIKRQHEELEGAYAKVKLLVEIGQQITASLSLENIIETVYSNVNNLMDASVFGIGIYNEKLNRIDFPVAMEKGQKLPEWYANLEDENRPPVWCFVNDKELLINDFNVEYTKFTNKRPKVKVGESPESIIYLPLKIGNKKIGVITVQSFRKYAYSEYHFDILRSMASHVSIALQNSSTYRKLTEAFDQLKAAQTKLVESEKMASLGVLTAGVAHEINNPVNFISGGISSLQANYSDIKELLQKYLQLSAKANGSEEWAEVKELEEELEINELMEEMEQLFTSIKNGVSRTSEIVAGLRNFSRLSENNKKRASLEEGIDSTLVILNNNLKNRIEVVKNYAGIDEVACFPGEMNQVFLNIINNAADAIEGKGQIRITTKQDDQYAIVEIEDSGEGMPEEVRSKIFEPFYTTKAVGKGTGLGLSIVYGIVDKHGGQIDVESELGKGTKFSIRIPREE